MATKTDKKNAIRQAIIEAAGIYRWKQSCLQRIFIKMPKKKLPCLKRLPELTTDMVCILKGMQTITITYKLSVTNLEFTLGLTENVDENGKKINEFFVPMSLRVEDSSVEKSMDGDIVDFIFSKDASVSKYDNLLVQDKRKEIPEVINHLISDRFLLVAINDSRNMKNLYGPFDTAEEAIASMLED